MEEVDVLTMRPVMSSTFVIGVCVCGRLDIRAAVFYVNGSVIASVFHELHALDECESRR